MPLAHTGTLHQPIPDQPTIITAEYTMAEAIIETRGLTKNFRGFTAVNDISIGSGGTIHAMIGANGAGKTTCFNLLTKFLEPSARSVLYQGRDITASSRTRWPGNGMVRSFQISAVFGHLNALETSSWHCSASAANPTTSGPRITGSTTTASCHEAAGDVGLRTGPIPAAELPYGRKRALELATTLAPTW
ncbi:ATP-binding cassette domain-containing protein [Billgrantia gudaonensis]|uniref:ATP-binding cassette domain-containing protein n=1 Tax=Billgrantia gudaonensis TaxID=376427 RepID=A0A3S0QGB0_9GAMM|nr:ATP-binding cassette domain-containing protein [Halomonas gudaonensis]